MLVKSQKKEINRALCTIMSHLHVWEASNILALKFFQIIVGMYVCCLEAGKRAYYAFDNT